MPEDAGGIRRDVLSCGTVDLRRGHSNGDQSGESHETHIWGPRSACPCKQLASQHDFDVF